MMLNTPASRSTRCFFYLPRWDLYFNSYMAVTEVAGYRYRSIKRHVYWRVIYLIPMHAVHSFLNWHYSNSVTMYIFVFSLGISVQSTTSSPCLCTAGLVGSRRETSFFSGWLIISMIVRTVQQDELINPFLNG